jgi:hypothetical protein
MIAFTGNAIGIFSSLVAASLTIMGARDGRRAAVRSLSAAA